MDELLSQKVFCLMPERKEDHWLWYRKCGDTSLRFISKLVKHDLVRGPPIMSLNENLLCEACVKAKQLKSSFKSKNNISTQRPLELIHLEHFGPTRIEYISGKRYCLVMKDDFTRWTWVKFLKHKDESFKVLCNLFKQIQKTKWFIHDYHQK